MTILIEAQLRNAIAAMKCALKTIDESNPAYSILQYSITTSDLALEVSEVTRLKRSDVLPAGLKLFGKWVRECFGCETVMKALTRKPKNDLQNYNPVKGLKTIATARVIDLMTALKESMKTVQHGMKRANQKKRRKA